MAIRVALHHTTRYKYDREVEVDLIAQVVTINPFDAFGRDFADVTPVHGVILGRGKHPLKVSVDVEPMP